MASKHRYCTRDRCCNGHIAFCPGRDAAGPPTPDRILFDEGFKAGTKVFNPHGNYEVECDIAWGVYSRGKH